VDGRLQVRSGAHPRGWTDEHGRHFNDGEECASCHGATLEGGSGPSCRSCHSDWRTDCNFCHGSGWNAQGAPPAGVDGETAATARQVGRHELHLRPGTPTPHAPIACETCHRVPDDALAAGHVLADPTPEAAEVTLGRLAAGGSWTAGTQDCTTYCHGDGTAAGRGSARWTDEAAASCTSCHGNPPSSGEHRRHRGRACTTCHPAPGAQHVDGTRQVSLEAWNPETRRCSRVCHGEESW
jgi:predicted CxxxxCH...CXXCH cytochrome family protein